jgi:hypothetical protein
VKLKNGERYDKTFTCLLSTDYTEHVNHCQVVINLKVTCQDARIGPEG